MVMVVVRVRVRVRVLHLEAGHLVLHHLVRVAGGAHPSTTTTTLGLELLLEDGDVGDAAVDGVAEARLGLVRQRVHGVLPLLRLQVVEQLRHVARAEHLVHVGELGRLVRREVGREHAPLRALPPQQLARRARRARRRHLRS
ncbi:Os03g0612450, partial [Oryza sativa Japonica Group]